jgi:hypothetical protein
MGICVATCAYVQETIYETAAYLYIIYYDYTYIVANSHPRWAAVVRWRRLVSYFIAEGSAAIRQNVRLFFFIYLFVLSVVAYTLYSI